MVKSVRGINKVRDLPASGIVYINRIKPISDDFRGAAALADNTFVKENSAAPLRELIAEPQKSAENDYKAYDDSHPKEDGATAAVASDSRAIAQIMDSAAVLSTVTTPPAQEVITEFLTMPPIRRTTTKEMEFESNKPEKNVLKIAISKKAKNVEPPQEYDLSREAQVDLERLISQIKEQEKVDLINEHPGVSTIDMPKAAMFTQRTSRHGGPSAKLVSLSRTAKIHTGQIIRKPSKAKLVQLRKKKSFGVVGAPPRRGPDFDPWERQGQ
ncbi:hypothetical protein Aduo_001206 [Ancylostoma duodenale]